MHVFVKIWKPKESWLNMSLEDRKNFVAKAQNALQRVNEMGLETTGWLEINPVNEDRFDSGFLYCSIYKAKENMTMNAFHNAMFEFGWYDHFDQLNVVGELESPGAVLTRVMQLGLQSENEEKSE